MIKGRFLNILNLRGGTMILNKRGQLDHPVITFVIIIFALMILAPVVLKIFYSVKTPISDAFGNMSDKGGAVAQTNFNAVMNTGITFWDKVVISAVILATLLMFISAFLVDTNPLWLILYIIISFLLVLFAPDIIGSLDNIYNSPTFAVESANLTFIGSLRDHFGTILVGVIVITGIIMYGKVALTGGGRR